MMSPKSTIIFGAVFMALAVVFGAFGAHIVQDLLTADRFDVYKTGVEYHFYHALGLLILGAVSKNSKRSRWFEWSGVSFIAGILIFSGSLYILTLTDTGWLGIITPVGGFAFIIGWLLFAAGVYKQQQ